MNKVVIDFPPGGLGHFIARVLNNDYNFQSGKLGEFHSQEHNYESITGSFENFEKNFQKSDKNKNVVCLHNFNNTNLGYYFPDHKLINVFLDDKLDIYTNNFYYKAIGSDYTTKKNFIDKVKEKYPNSPNAIREEFFNFYSWLSESSLVNEKPDYINLPFSWIYRFDKLNKFFKNNDLIIPANLEEIHRDFLVKQSNIVEKSKNYSLILENISNRKNYQIPKEFNDVDFGIVSSMVYKLTGKDIINLYSVGWFTDTAEIIDYGKI
jgi:hypothetical protein